MNRSFGLGGVLFLAGGLLFILNLLSQLMKGQEDRFRLTLFRIMGEERLAWVGDLSEGVVRSSLDYILTMPLYAIFFFSGLFLILLSGFRR